MNSRNLSNVEEFKSRMLYFVRYEISAKEHSAEEVASITFSSPLFEGFVSSLGVVELIAFIEQELGIKISMREVVMKHFRTINDISTKFWPKRSK